jgi:hypothetical protein
MIASRVGIGNRDIRTDIVLSTIDAFRRHGQVVQRFHSVRSL